MNTEIRTQMPSERVVGLLQRQWSSYSAAHQNRTNLLIHLFAVPLFMLATVGLVFAVLRLSIILGVLSLIGLVVALALQAKGHALEPVAPEPFAGGLDFVRRLFAEQWITFPRFVISGGWLRNFFHQGVV
jgi:hypothetical protein